MENDLRDLKLTINPNLKNFGIQRIINPYQAYQEIDMYLSNTLASSKEVMPDFGDILKRDAHGLDEFSFKQKGPKARKRKKK